MNRLTGLVIQYTLWIIVYCECRLLTFSLCPRLLNMSISTVCQRDNLILAISLSIFLTLAHSFKSVYICLSQRDERTLEVAMEAVLQRVIELKQSLAQLLQKLEQEGESADWPQYLQQYSVISAQVVPNSVKICKILPNVLELFFSI